MKRILVAGMGNILLRDDGFGVEVVRRLALQDGLPRGVKVMDVGIGGIHLVQELMAGYDALVVVDAMERGSEPGTLRLLEAEVPELETWPEEDRRDFLADMHYATPSKALILSKALGRLPPRVFLLGCQPADTSDLGLGLTGPIDAAADRAVDEVRGILRSLLETTKDRRTGS
jgi:hydrogenase maturation protease